MQKYTIVLYTMLCGVLSLSACQTIAMQNNSNIATRNTMATPVTVGTEKVTQKRLTSYDWQLISVVDNSNKSLMPLTTVQNNSTLKFVNTSQKLRASFGVGCNKIGAPVDVSGDSLVIHGSSLLMTRMYCVKLDKAEKQLVDLMTMKSQLSLSVNDNQQTALLTQITSDGSRLQWQGNINNSVKYGKAETVFLEVDPQTVRCSSGINQTCLKVRDIYYNKNWIKSGKSDWRMMKQTIEGYNHNPKNRTILRLKKYITNPSNVKGKQLKYVFDMAVETEIVSR